MVLRQFINSFLGDFCNIVINDYIGPTASIGAEPEDYERIGVYASMRDIPENLLNRKMEYFNIDDGDYPGYDLTIFLMTE